MSVPTLAIHGGSPVRRDRLPYGRQAITDADVDAVVRVLKSDWLTTGPIVPAFERRFAERVESAHAVALSSGTAALHASAHALQLGSGDEVIVPAITFAASANCVVYRQATPVFADVDRNTLLLTAAEAERRITPRTRAIIAVDYAGQPCAYDALAELAARHGLALVADACHSLGASYRGRAVGTLADLNVFSFHPVKHITTGEGGMVTTSRADLAERMRTFRNHGISQDRGQRDARGQFFYEMTDLGFNYRLTDFQAALGLSQLGALVSSIARRRAIAARYDAAFAGSPVMRPLCVADGVEHAYHLYVIRLTLDALTADRNEIYAALRAEGLDVNVHYVPVHLHPYYQRAFGTAPGLCPNAEGAYPTLITLPLFPRMTDADIDDVVAAVAKVTEYYRR